MIKTFAKCCSTCLYGTDDYDGLADCLINGDVYQTNICEDWEINTDKYYQKFGDIFENNS